MHNSKLSYQHGNATLPMPHASTDACTSCSRPLQPIQKLTHRHTLIQAVEIDGHLENFIQIPTHVGETHIDQRRHFEKLRGNEDGDDVGVVEGRRAPGLVQVLDQPLENLCSCTWGRAYRYRPHLSSRFNAR